jgi:hypothetical protein
MMTDPQYKLTPMQNTQSIPVHWEFNQDDYDKLVEGHQSNWSVFLRGDVVHFCRRGGEEFYRFAISNAGDELYITDDLEVYLSDNFYKFARQHGWTEKKIERHQTELKELVIEEITGLLNSYFGIRVTEKPTNN